MKNRLAESDLNRIVKESVNKVLNESSDVKRQWESEKRAFFRGLKDGKAIVEDNMVAVELGRHNERDPRYVCFRFGDNKLTDDHFYVQNSPTLSKRSLINLYRLLNFVYGADVSEYIYDEDYGGLRMESDLRKIVKEVVTEIRRKINGRPSVDKKQYKTNKEAPIGSEIVCATCGTPMTKKTMAQAFCSRSCKDKYHNGISSDRHKDPNYYNKYNKKMGRTYDERFGTKLINKTFDGNHGYDYDDWEDYGDDDGKLDYYNGEELLGDFYPGDND